MDNLKIKVNKSNSFQNYFQSSISEIENSKNEPRKQLNLNEETIKDHSICSYINLDEPSFIQVKKSKNENENNNIKKKLTKEDLDNIPLPIFSCIYCSNDHLSFNHLSNEVLSEKYYNQTSIYDMKLLEKLIQNGPLIEQDNFKFKLLDIIIQNTEYIRKYYNSKESLLFYSSQMYKESFDSYNDLKTKKYILKQLEERINLKRNRDLTNRKSLRFANKNICYNKLSFHNNSNILLNENYNFNQYIKKNSNTNGTGTCQGTGSYSSMNNIVSFSLNNNENNNILLCMNNLNMMENIMEKIEKNEESENDEEGGQELLHIFEDESHCKTRKNKIDFETKYYDVWNPDITEIESSEKEKDSRSITSIVFKEDRNIIKNTKLNRNHFILDDNKIKSWKLEENTQDIFSEPRKGHIKNIFKSLKSPKNIKRQNENKNVEDNSKKNISKTKKVLEINLEQNKNCINQRNNNLDDTYLKRNEMKFKSFYINKKPKNHKKLLNLLYNKKTNNLIIDSLHSTKEGKQNINCNEKEKDNTKDENSNKNEKGKNITLNTINQQPNLLFLLQNESGSLCESNIRCKLSNQIINSPTARRTLFYSYKKKISKDIPTLFSFQEIFKKASSKMKNSTDKMKLNNNNKFTLSDFYEINDKRYNSRNEIMRKRDCIHKNSPCGCLIKSNSALFNYNLKNKSGHFTYNNFKINLSKIIHKEKTKETINQFIKKLLNKENNKINIKNAFICVDQKKRFQINNELKKLKNNNLKIPLLQKRSTSVIRPFIKNEN